VRDDNPPWSYPKRRKPEEQTEVMAATRRDPEGFLGFLSAYAVAEYSTFSTMLYLLCPTSLWSRNEPRFRRFGRTVWRQHSTSRRLPYYIWPFMVLPHTMPCRLGKPRDDSVLYPTISLLPVAICALDAMSRLTIPQTDAQQPGADIRVLEILRLSSLRSHT